MTLGTNHQSKVQVDQPCNCKVCCASDSSINHYRRRAMLGLLAGLMLSRMLPARAGDDLLDPSQIGTAKNLGAEDLLDPTQMNAKAAPSGASKHSSAYARDMAVSVVSSLNSLTLSAASLVDEVNNLDKKIRELAAKQKTLQDEMVIKLGEYRSGLFCSGCNKTKSEILARGETFPHPGQTIIRPTPEQIAAKERELQTPIDNISRELRELRKKREKAVAERDEAMQQIEAGLALWQTSISFENSLILQDDDKKETAYKSERAKYEMKIEALKMAKKDSAKSASDKNEIKNLSDSSARLNSQRADQRRITRRNQAQAKIDAENECNKLNDYFSRGSLSQLTTLVANTGFVSPSMNFNGLGGLYRMGNYDVSQHDEVLPAVNSFIASFRSSPNYNPENAFTQPVPDVPYMQKLKGTLKDMLKCDPDAGEKCAPPRKNVGTGVRG